MYIIIFFDKFDYDNFDLMYFQEVKKAKIWKISGKLRQQNKS